MGNYLTRVKNALTIVKNQGPLSLVKRVRTEIKRALPAEMKYYFISHPMDQTGAPIVLLDLLAEFSEHTKTEKMLLLAPSIDQVNKKLLAGLKINYQLFPTTENNPAINNFIDSIKKHDFVLMNTIAIAYDLRDKLFSLLETGRLNKLHWYLHDDDPKTHFFYKEYQERVEKLLAAGKLIIYTLSRGVHRKYERFFKQKIKLLPYRFKLEQKYFLDRKDSDFSQIRFCVSGDPAYGRKGHAFILASFLSFYYQKYLPNKDKYRPFKLVFIGLNQDFISRQLIDIGRSVLGNQFEYHLKVPRSECLDLEAQCNANICHSYNESLPLNVMESMFMGHFLLRNDCSGLEEQLVAGKNGYFLKTGDVAAFVAALDQALNKKLTSNNDLNNMGKYSQKLVLPYAKNSYYRNFIQN